jgi:branched-chain amino acid transport system ATP-binding protein
MMLEVRDLHCYYGSSHVVQGIDLDVDRGEVVTLLGRNGAGKTTTLRGMAGLIPVRRGTATLGGRQTSGRAPHVAARLGMAYVPSGRRVFGTLTVAENLQVAAASARRRSGPWTIGAVHELFPKLAVLAKRRAGLLSGGEQQMLKLARALLSNPDLLLLDEPTEGLSPAVVHELGEWLDQLRAQGLGVLLTEQNAIFALEHADRGYILEKGLVRASGTRAELTSGTALHTYLGIGGGQPTMPDPHVSERTSEGTGR